VKDIARSVIETAAAHGVSLAAAESLTGGMVAAALVDIPGASQVFKGSIVAYDLMVKHDLLGVDAAELATRGAVSADVASQMAENAAERMGADFAVATTGVAGPDPDAVSGQKPGVAFIAVAGGTLGTMVRQLMVDGDREQVRMACTKAALQALLDALDMRE
jgi:nicotinamide-nucleotide amidase